MEGPPTPHRSAKDGRGSAAELVHVDTETFEEGIAAEDLSSSVPSHETKQQDSEDFPEYCDLSPYEQLRHRGNHALRKLTYSYLESAKKKDGYALCSSNVLRRFRHCGSCCQVNHSESENKYFLTADVCRNRWCPACAKSLRTKVARNLTKLIGPRTVRFVTFGLQHGDQPLHVLLDRLKVCFFNLTRRKSWTDHVTGFAVFFEVKRTKYWHVHAHILYEGSYWYQSELSHEWYAVTGDSYVVDIRALTSEGGIRYAAKYASKPANIVDIEEELRPYIISELHGRRLYHLGGTWKKWKIRENEKLPADLKPVGDFSSLWFDARRGEDSALQTLRKAVNDNTLSPPPFGDEFGDSS